MDKFLYKVVIYAVAFFLAVYIWLRIAVPYTLGMKSDLILFAVPAAFAVGAVVVIYLANVFFKDIKNELNKFQNKE